MVDSIVSEEDHEIIGAQIINWEHMLDDVPEGLNPFDLDLDFELDLSLNSVVTADGLNSSPDLVSLSIDEIEHLLMKDDEENLDFSNDLLSNFLVDSPVESYVSGEAVADSDGKHSNASTEEEEKKEKEKVDFVLPKDAADSGDGNDPITKKRKRQLRNRDAAVRSRERKKMYVRDLEMKSRYLEGECKRLGMLLQCCFAENQALRLSLQNNSKPFDASRTKQESAVLFLESLLLGSLLWFLGLVCLLILPRPLHPTVEVLPLESVGDKNQGSLVPRKVGSKIFGLRLFQSFIMGKRCKASRFRMKPTSLRLEVLLQLL